MTPDNYRAALIGNHPALRYFGISIQVHWRWWERPRWLWWHLTARSRAMQSALVAFRRDHPT